MYIILIFIVVVNSNLCPTFMNGRYGIPLEPTQCSIECHNIRLDSEFSYNVWKYILDKLDINENNFDPSFCFEEYINTCCARLNIGLDFQMIIFYVVICVLVYICFIACIIFSGKKIKLHIARKKLTRYV